MICEIKMRRGTEMRCNKKDAIMDGKIEVRFNWDAFPRQYSGGLFGGLFGDSTSVDCDARAVFCDAEGMPVSPRNREACLSYLDPDMFQGEKKYRLRQDTELLHPDSAGREP